MGNIVLLDDLTINKIAAGEVIERPASVIKEMVENSIDAGANNITVEIKNGGISFIKVTDNGKGISEDDLEIAFERHATSKIRNAEDLNTVKSMGFRGEALASISAISNVEMISKTEGQVTGFKIIVEAGRVLEKEEVGCQTGTSITVRNLFFNTPVRYKFLKKDYTESGYIEDVITRIALIHPEIAIKLINIGKTVIQTNGNGDMKNVIYSIYGKDVVNGVIPVEYNYEDIQISGVVGKPEIARSNRSNQLFFVNKRHIKDKILTAATEQAFKGLIQLGKFGFVILNLNMNPSKVDVNVHPAKLEVRFEDEGTIFQAVYHAIKDTLEKDNFVSSNVEEKKEEKLDLFNTKKENVFEEKEKEEKEEKQEKQETKVVDSIKFGQPGPVNTADVLEQLRKMREDLEKQIKENPDIKLSKDYIEMQQEEEKYNKQDENYEKIQKNVEESTETTEKYTDIGQTVENYSENSTIKEKIEYLKNLDNIEEKQDEKVAEKNVIYNEEEKIENTEMETSEIEKSEVETENIEVKNEELEKLEEPKEQIEQIEQKNIFEEEPKLDFDEMYAKLFGRKPVDSIDNSVDIKKDNISIFEEVEEYKKPTYKFVGIIFDTYIIIEIEKEMYVIDKISIKERIMYESIKKNYYSENLKDSQLLVLADIITLSEKQMELARENVDMFEKAGFSFEEFGENTIKLTGVPSVCKNLDNKKLFIDVLNRIDLVSREEQDKKEDKFIYTIAQESSATQDNNLSQEKAKELIDELLQIENPFIYPDGKQISFKLAKYDIERKFSRK